MIQTSLYSFACRDTSMHCKYALSNIYRSAFLYFTSVKGTHISTFLSNITVDGQIPYLCYRLT